jgi:hypothetical protein
MNLSGHSVAGRAGLRKEALQMAAEQGASIGDMMMMPAQFLRPSPLLNAANDEYYQRQETANEQALAAQTNREDNAGRRTYGTLGRKWRSYCWCP